MPNISRPRKGSRGFSPRKRAISETPRIKTWPSDGEKPMIQGFAGYKAGMTHVELIDYRPTSTTSGQSVFVPVTIVETPPIKIAAIKYYENTPYGLKTKSEIWAKDIRELSKRVPIPKKKMKKKIDGFDEIRVIA